jgi:two-component sensor histidine kinase
VFNVYTRSPLSGWRISAAIPIATFDAPYYKGIGLIVLCIGTAMLVSLLLSYVYARRVIAPIQQLRSVAVAGDQQPVDQTGISDLDKLAATVADNLKALRAHERTQNTLIDELNHRVKNTLSIVQGLALLTRRRAASIPEFTKAFDNRMVALAKSHNVLSRANWSDCDVRRLILDCCAGFAEADRLRIKGDDFVLKPNAALKLCLVLHELATNATKHGALKFEEGFVSVSWSLSADGSRLVLVWEEHAPSVIAAKAEKGFGSELISLLIEQDLRGQLALSWKPNGLRVSMELPVENTIVVPAEALARDVVEPPHELRPQQGDDSGERGARQVPDFAAHKAGTASTALIANKSPPS